MVIEPNLRLQSVVVVMLCLVADTASLQAADLLTIDNGAVKLGIDRETGGATTWLSSGGYQKNMVSITDPGRRLIQQSSNAGRRLDRRSEGQVRHGAPGPGIQFREEVWASLATSATCAAIWAMENGDRKNSRPVRRGARPALRLSPWQCSNRLDRESPCFLSLPVTAGTSAHMAEDSAMIRPLVPACMWRRSSEYCWAGSRPFVIVTGWLLKPRRKFHLNWMGCGPGEKSSLVDR